MKKDKNREFGLQWNKGTWWFLLICSILLLTCLLLCAQHVYRVISKYRALVDDSIMSQTILDAELVANQLLGDMQVIEASAEQIRLQDFGDSELDRTEAYNLLRGIKDKTALERVVMIQNDGNTYSSERYSTMSGFNSLIPMEDTDKVWVQKTYYDFGDGMASYCIAAPIINDGLLCGYLFGINSSTHLLEGTEMDTYNDISRSYVLNEQGKIMSVGNSDGMLLIQNDDFYVGILANLTRGEDSDVIEQQIRQSFGTGRAGYYDMVTPNDTMRFYYSPVKNQKDWIYVNIVARSDVSNLISDMKFGTIVTSVAVILLMVGIAAVVFLYVMNEQREIIKLAFEDNLTKAPNSRRFIMVAEKILKEYPDLAYRMVCYDIMNFRYLNEAYGHIKADSVLRSMVEICDREFGNREYYGRISADKFVALMVDDGRCEERFEHIEERLGAAAINSNITYPIKLKCGFYEIRSHKEDISGTIDKADLARKSLASQSKDTMSVYKDSLMEETRKREYIESRMEMALTNEEFIPYLQPKWDMQEDHICGAEALIRWKQPTGQIYPPGMFIDIFEKNGFIEKIDFYMLEQVCKYLRRMLDEGRAVYPISVNQSRYLLHDPNYTMNVQQVLLKYKIPKGLIELELTETVFFQEKERMFEVMNDLKNMNLELSVDDFGSGYSSLNLIRDIPFDVLKIDREFLNQTNASDSGRIILKKIVEMAEGLGVRVICEGVETIEQVHMLLDIGCIYAQGYYYSKPIPMEEYVEKYNIVK